jgi:hypothetical protein
LVWCDDFLRLENVECFLVACCENFRRVVFFAVMEDVEYVEVFLCFLKMLNMQRFFGFEKC